VASWLPGSEGAGVADVLFGKRPFTGRLSMTWPRSADQVPINVGDANYQPLYPFGWGLRTGDGGQHSSASIQELESQLKDSANRDDILAFMHDLAQDSVVAGRAPSDWAARIADAEHAQLTGDYLTAFRMLVSVI
jgi:beta-glucosidase